MYINHSPYEKELFKLKLEGFNQHENTELSNIDLAINRMAEEVIENRDLENDPPPNLFIPAHLRYEKMRNEIKNELESAELNEFLPIALQALVDDGRNNVELEDYETMCDRISSIPDLIDKMDFSQPIKTDLQTMLQIEDSVMDSIYKIAQLEFHPLNKFLESLSIFTFLHALSPGNIDYSYRLGIVALESDRLELAIRALSNTIKLDPEFYEAQIYLVESYLRHNDFDEAKKEFEKIDAINLNSIDRSMAEMIHSIQNSLAKIS
jgi:tetratricopeptide (TPR) repeat protein